MVSGERTYRICFGAIRMEADKYGEHTAVLTATQAEDLQTVLLTLTESDARRVVSSNGRIEIDGS